jgi:SAM-dependent methyltransferase
MLMSTAQVQGRLWGARARDYADVAEPAFRPLFEAVFTAVGVQAGTRLLDVGCGPGLAAQLAARRGAQVAGIDAAASSIAIARERTPEGDFRVGEMERLPWSDHAFDAVTGFNSFPFAADMLQSLREARRVATAGGKVAMAVWGRAEECELFAVVGSINPLLPPAPPAAQEPIPLSAPGRIESLTELAGLTPVTRGEAHCPFEFPDLDTAVRAITSAGIMVAAGERAGDQLVRRTVAEALAPFRTSQGGYRLRNTLVYVIATA